MQRNTFRPWEIELLLDIESCNLREINKRDTLRRYQKAVQRHMEKGARVPLKLSEYLSAVKTKRRAGGARNARLLNPGDAVSNPPAAFPGMMAAGGNRSG